MAKFWRKGWCTSFFTVLFMLFLASPAVWASETVVYSQGFESDNGGFTLYGGTSAQWQWGTPAYSGGPASCNNGLKCWGTNLNGTLPRPCDSSIISPPIALPAISANQLIRVRFWGYVDIDGMYDRAEFFVSKDGVTWQSMAELYHIMNSNYTAGALWQKYEFTLDPSYAGGNIYLRFRTAVYQYSPTFYCGGTGNLSGFYVDDLAITVFDTDVARKVFSLEAYEDASTWASCPWVAPWNGSEYKVDNDIYSVARTAQGEYTDYYKLMKPLVAKNGVYPVEVQELQSEDSYTDLVSLIQVDHPADVAVAPDDKGNLVAYRPASLQPPQAATSGQGENVLELVSAEDGVGYAAYSESTVLVDFGMISSGGVALILGITGFVMGEGQEMPYIGPPAVVVETQDAGGVWQERGRLLPRFQYSLGAFDLTPYLSGGPLTVRLRSISHSVKYNLIDYVALAVGTQPAFTAREVKPSAAQFGTTSILDMVGATDRNYFKMQKGEKFSLEFPVLSLAPGNVREFIFVSRGYYIPKSGSYLVYTWDGSNWVLRDAYTFPGSDFTKSFDLSLFLPDPSGDYKIRVWQDYQYEPAGIDFVSMTVGGTPAPLNYAHDFRYNTDIFNLVVSSDNQKDTWQYCPRNRITEFHFTPPTSNRPPSTCPVYVITGPLTIYWTFVDQDGDAQAKSEVQVWTGPGATGTIVWNPPVFNGSANYVLYTGPALTPGTEYYVRVRANDGKDWGPWCEAVFSLGVYLPCDVNKDGVVNIDDINIIFAGRGQKAQPGDLRDYDGDGLITVNDARACVLKCTKMNCAR